jgi:hypothetical protein
VGSDVALLMYELLAMPEVSVDTIPGKLVLLALERAADKHNMAIQVGGSMYQSQP